MQKVVHRLRLDLERPGIQAVSYMRKGDTLSRRMVLSLYEQGKPYRIEDGVTARIRGKKSDGTILYNDCFVQDNCIVVDVTTQMLAALGEVECELNLYGTSNALLTTPRFSIVVEDVLLADGQLESQNEFTAMTKATEEMKTLYDTVDKAYKSGAFKGEKGDKGDDGAPGKDGADGKDGAQGKDGSPGTDGVSPTLSISDIPGGHRVTITDASGQKSFDVLNGDAESDKLWKPTVSPDGTIAWTKTTSEDTPTPQNIKGAQGNPGTPGSPGADGVSPSVAVAQITGGHRVSVTDADGTKTFDVLDGEKGEGADITIDANLDIDSANPVQNKAVTLAISGKADAAHIHTADQIIEGVFPIERGGTDASTASGARDNLVVPQRPKLLWSGSWSSGTITVPGFTDYLIFLIKSSSGDMAVCWFDVGTSYKLLLGGAQYALNATQQLHFTFRASFNGDTLTLQHAYALEHTYNAGHTASYSRSISQIYGLFLKNEIQNGG